MAKFPDWYKGRLPDWMLKQDEEIKRGDTKVVGARPWPTYDPAFLAAELRRYERDYRDLLDSLTRLDTATKYDAQNPHMLNTIELYREGVFETFGWFLGRNSSPLNGFQGPPTEQDYRVEMYLAHNMHRDADRLIYGTPMHVVYGDFEHWFVVGVYKTLRWITADPQWRHFDDPDVDPFAWL